MPDTSRHAPIFAAIRQRLIATGLLKHHAEGVTLIFTSRRRGDGVSTTVAGLARAFGAATPGETLVLDADDSGRRVSTLLAPNARRVTLQQALAPGADPTQWITRSEKIGVDLLAVDGNASDGDPENGIRDLLDQLHRTYRVVVVDAGAILGPNAYHWLTCGGDTILVVDTSSTTIEALQRVRSEIDQSEFELKGFILNRRKYPVPNFIYRWLG